MCLNSPGFIWIGQMLGRTKKIYALNWGKQLVGLFHVVSGPGGRS